MRGGREDGSCEKVNEQSGNGRQDNCIIFRHCLIFCFHYFAWEDEKKLVGTFKVIEKKNGAHFLRRGKAKMGLLNDSFRR